MDRWTADEKCFIKSQKVGFVKPSDGEKIIYSDI